MLYELLRKNRGDWWVLADPQWVRANRGVLFCPKCERRFTHLFPRPLDVRLLQLPKGRTADRVDRSKIGVMRRDLYQMLRPHMGNHFAIGRCFDGAGEEIKTHVTCYTNYHVVIRGGPESEYKSCPECGSIYYLPRGDVDPYVLRKDLTGQQVYHNSFSLVLVTQELANSLDWKPFKDIELFPLPIRDVPLDGRQLPGDPPEWAHLPAVD